MDFRKNEIKGIITELLAVSLYIALIFAAAVIIMR
jgi:hypothetical protein